MLKLMRFPRGTNRNRTLKPQNGPDLNEADSNAQLERLFRRLWRERTGTPVERAGAGSEIWEEQATWEQ